MIKPLKKTILIFGATGKTGSYTVQCALDAQDDVHVFVRNPDKLPAAIKEKVSATVGDITNYSLVMETVKKVSPDAIIICSGHPPKDAVTPLNSIAVSAIVQALTDSNRLKECFVIYLSGLFAAPFNDPLPWYAKMVRSVMVPMAGYQASISDNLEVTKYLTEGAGSKSGLQFTIVRMGYPVDSVSKGLIVPVDYNPFGAVTFTDMGLFLVKLAHSEYRELALGKAIKVSYSKKK